VPVRVAEEKWLFCETSPDSRSGNLRLSPVASRFARPRAASGACGRALSDRPRFERAFGLAPRPWGDALAEVMDRIGAEVYL
jgi:hypothetical protein